VRYAECHKGRKHFAKDLCKSCYQHSRDMTPAGRQARRNRRMKSRYGIDQVEYDRLFAAQDGTCALCNKQAANIPLHVDHDHVTGIVRGLLCIHCNGYLGKVDKDPTILHRIKEYRRRGELLCEQ